MIKENYTPGDSFRDDMFIILGVHEIRNTAAKHKFDVKDVITKLLRDDLGLEVLLTGQVTTATAKRTENPFDPITNGSPTQLASPTRRPALIQRLKVTKSSLYRWLKRRSSHSKR